MRKLLISLLALALAAPFSRPAPAAAKTEGVGGYGCPNGLFVTVTDSDPGAPPPFVDWHLGNLYGYGYPRGSLPNPLVNNGQGRDWVYWLPASLYPTSEATGTLRARGASGEAYATFRVESECPPLGSVRGVAFEDNNRNGWLDAGEGLITTASWKLTGGGDWFICGYVGGDATYGPTVLPGSYHVVPIAQPGWRATTPVRTATVKDLAYAALGFNLGFVRDARSAGDNCSQYTPPSGTPPAVPGIPPGYPPGPPPPVLPGVPPTAVSGTNIPGTLSSYGIFNTLLALAQASGQLSYLNTATGITLFAPTDAAFAKLPPGTLNAWLANPRQLANIIRCHIVSGQVPTPQPGFSSTHRGLCGKLVTLRNAGGLLSATGDAYANASGAIQTTSGVIYPVDAVLFTR